MDIRKMIILSELDELSAKVTGFAVNLAEQMNISEIVLLNLIIPAHAQAYAVSGDVFAVDGQMASRFNPVMIEKRQKLAEEEAEKFTTEKVNVKPFVRFNDSRTDLNKYMEEFEAGLIVCGSRDEHTFLHLLFGSDTESMIRKVDYPLIILQDEADAGDIRNILVAIDIHEEDQTGLSEIAAFARSLNAGMQLLHVLTDDSYSSDQAIKKLRELAIKNMFGNYDINVVNNDSLEDGIRNFARKQNPDMIAVLSQGKGKIHKLVFGSSTADIIKETDKPVFVSKIHNDTKKPD
jgi:nucleotide-binding universal stress UspA family protein